MQKKEGNFKKIIYTIIVAFAIISFWRGVWGLMDLYLFPTNLALSFSISILIGIIILYLTKHLLDSLR
ncbi:hypothetical protein ACFL0X_01970 [Nanoarchaeota archaeon]